MKCTIVISDNPKPSILVTWDAPPSADSQKLSWVERAASGAILGIGKAVTGAGSVQLLQTIKLFRKDPE
jgi:hypothetical protein